MTDTDETLNLPARNVDPQADLEDRLTDNVLYRIGPARYFQKNENGEVLEDWNGVFHRVAQNVAQAELEYGGQAQAETWADYFEDMMRKQLFVPNSPTLMNAGDAENPKQDSDLQQLSACFVLNPEDDLIDIFQNNRKAAEIFRSGGGVGYAFHHLRPQGARIESTGSVSSGPMTFMQVFDSTCRTVEQGGKRRGAQMGIMHVEHPDVGRFAVSKRDETFDEVAALVEEYSDAVPPNLREWADGNLSNFNISIGFTDEFMQAVRDDSTYTLKRTADHGMADEPFPVARQTKHFYDPQYEDAWNEQFGKPGVDADGKQVRENLWRDYDLPESVLEYKDEIDLEIGEPMELPAGLIWELFLDGNHMNGEPGFVNLENINDEHSFDVDEHPEYQIDATNPCAEQALLHGEACNLGHVNLSLMADDNGPNWRSFVDEIDNWETADEDVKDAIVQDFLMQAMDWDQFVKTTRGATRFLDDVVDKSEFPLEEIDQTVDSLRKIGVGMMGLAQLFIQLGVEYGSDDSYRIARVLTRELDRIATETSHELAKDRGVFPAYEESKWANPTEYPDWIEQHGHVDPEQYEDGYELRNHNVTTVAPTGTTSMVGNTSAGCEPIFSVAFYKNVGDDIQGDELLVEFDDYFLRVLEANEVDIDEVKRECQDLMEANEFESVGDLETVPEEIAEIVVTTSELDPEQHVRIQSAIQTHIDSGISKTINVPFDADPDDIGDALLLATELGIKGCTVYRDGSRRQQVKQTRKEAGLKADPLAQKVVSQHIDNVAATDAEVELEEAHIRELLGVHKQTDTVDEGGEN